MRRVIATFCCLAFLATFISGYIFQQSLDRIDSLRLLTTASRSLLISCLDAETGQRGYIITGDDGYLDPYHAGMSSIPLKLANLQKLLLEADASATIDDINQLVAAKQSELERTIALRVKSEALAKAEVDRHLGKNYMDEIRRRLDQLEMWSDTTFKKEEETVMISGRIALVAMVATLIMGSVLAAKDRR